MPDLEFEPERYELREKPAYDFLPTRREFVEIAGLGLLVTVIAGEAEAGTEVAGRLLVADDGTVTVFTGKVEVGQGSRTELAMAAAEELGVPLDKITVVMADTDRVPVDGITAGSRTTPSTVPAVRKAAAEARERLRPGSGPTGKMLGSSHYRTDAREIVTGRHQYPSDIRRRGMLYGAVLRAPAYNATLQSIDSASVRDATVVYDGTFAGCVAPTSYGARQAVARLAETAKWEIKEHPASQDLFTHLRENMSPAGRGRDNSRGSVTEALAAGARRLKAEFHVPYIQHAPMEPRAAVAEWTGGKLAVWTGTQNPHGVRDQLAQAFHLDKAAVRVIVPDTGGGFGGKHTGECAIEAARLARAAGKPVSLRWTRPEEFAWAYFRPAGVFEIEAALDAAGNLHAWDFLNINAGAAAIDTPYRVPNLRTRFRFSKSPLREGSYRGIAATANNFARECFMDELAALAGADPVEFRLSQSGSERLSNVVKAAARSFGWEHRAKGSGIACGTEKGSYVAACAEVDLRAGRIHVRRITMAFECGAILNPANLRSQVEGSIIQGLGGALSEEIRFENGKLLNGSFSRYPVPRFRDVPKLDIVLVDRPDLPSAGAGETPIIAVAPAIANAWFHATGVRPRSMPIRPAA